MPDDSDPQSGQSSTLAFPGLFSSCRASALKFTNDFAQCLSRPPNVCSFRLSYGRACYCYHPNRSEIIKQTSPEQA